MTLDCTLTRLATERGKQPPPRIDHSDSERQGAYLETRILIIEDEMMIAWMLESLLADTGFIDVTIASDHDEACRLAAETVPGLVISDINLGAGRDGVEASITICHAASIPVLFVTAYADDATRTRIAGHTQGRDASQAGRSSHADRGRRSSVGPSSAELSRAHELLDLERLTILIT